jgi:uncharacterized protein YbjT (DUF2867 family)
MATVLVTGGTGTLGRTLVPRLVAVGHDVRVLSRRTAPSVPPGATALRADVRTGEGVAEASSGADVVVHAASSPMRHMRATEVEGARHVADAAGEAGAHLVYVSIVGVDASRYPYYRAKCDAERIVSGAGARWTVQRATQFHDLLDLVLSKGWFIRTPSLAFQVVDVGEFADRLVTVVGGEPQGHAADFGGPEILPVVELNRQRADVTGRRARLVPVPRVGFLREFDEGRHHAPEHRDGRVTWGEWLRARAGGAG